jgi:rubredoxin
MRDTTCPECGTDVPEPLMASAGGIGDQQGNVSFQPYKQHAACPGCGKTLVRMKDAGPGEEWQVKE